jgi:hypothetical protein
MSVANQCLNCGNSILRSDQFCSRCGQKTSLGRLTLSEIGGEALHSIVHVDRSAASLIRSLAVRPGGVALDYVNGRRKRYFGPFAFLVVVVALTSGLIAISGFHVVIGDTPTGAASFLQHHVNLIFFAAVPVLAAVSRGLGRRDRFNYAEHLVLAAYTTAMHVLFYACVVLPVWYLFKSDDVLLERLYWASIPLWPLYFGFASSQFLSPPRWIGFTKGVTAVLLTEGVVLLSASGITRLFIEP